MFSKDDKSTAKDVETVIGASVKVRGDFNGQGNISIDGDFEGSLTTAGNLHAGAQSSINANISAFDAVVEGVVNGNIILEGHIEIGSTANIQGDIKAKSISIAKGAILNGRVLTGDQTKDSAETTS